MWLEPPLVEQDCDDCRLVHGPPTAPSTSHPCHRMLALAMQLPGSSWASAVLAEMRDVSLAAPILEIIHPCFTSDEVSAAQSCRETRKRMLRPYRTQVVLLALLKRDHCVFVGFVFVGSYSARLVLLNAIA